MATVVKDFKVKAGLVVEGANATVGGQAVLTKKQADQDYIVGLIGGTSTSENTANTVVKRDANGDFAARTITADLIGNVTGQVSDISNHSTSDLTEGSRKYFTDQRALDATSSTYDATGSAATAEFNAALDATTKANAAQAAAELTASGDATTKADAAQAAAKVYTDGRETAITTAYRSYADTAEADAISAAATDATNKANAAKDNAKGYTDDLIGDVSVDGTSGNTVASRIASAVSSANTAVDAHSDLTTGVHGVTGNVVGTSDAQTLTKKTMGDDLLMDGFQVSGLGTPTQADHAATKEYVDAISEGLHIHAAAHTIATVSLESITGGTVTYNNGTSGVGATLTMSSGLSIGDIDGDTDIVVGDRLIIAGQSNKAHNGIYILTSGTVLTRASDFDTPAEMTGGDFIFVTHGTTYADTGWVMTEAVTTVGTSPVPFTQFSGAGTYLAGNGLNLTGNTFSVDDTITATRTFATGEADAAQAAAKVYTDGRETAITTAYQSYADTAESDAISTAAGDATTKANAAEAAAKLYTDGRETAITTAYQTYADDQDVILSAALTLAFQSYTNSATTDMATNDYVNEQDGITLGAANAYADSLTTTEIDEGSNEYFTSERAQDAVATAIAAGTHENITITYDDNANSISFIAENGVADSDTDDLNEGATNLYFTDARAVSALEAVIPDFTEVDLNSVATQVAAASTGGAAEVVAAYTFATADYRSAKFLVKVAYGTHTQVSEVLLTLDTSDNISITEYAVVGTNGDAATVSADVLGSSVRLLVTPVNNSSSITVMGTLLK